MVKYGAISLGVLAVIGVIIGVVVLNDPSIHLSSNKASRFDEESAWIWCTEYVKETLDSPESADFSSEWNGETIPDSRVIKLGDDRFKVSSYVDAQNLSEATVRSNFVCIVQEQTNSLDLVYLNIAGKTYTKDQLSESKAAAKAAQDAYVSSQNVIGEWNDNVGASWKQIIKIINEGEKFFRVSVFQDGSTVRTELIELKAGPDNKRKFKDLKSSFGEIYVIDANGNLNLYDRDGFIRKAKRAK
jgi:hypothetical protein